MKLLTILLLVGLLPSCSNSSSKLVDNKKGKYTISTLPGWDYRIEGPNTRITKSENKVTGNGTVYISTIASKYKTLEESFTYGIDELKREFGGYEKLSEGRTQINGIIAMWHRMKDFDNGTSHVSVQYFMQPTNRTSIIITCSATSNTFKEFEEEFTKTVFSFKLSK